MKVAVVGCSHGCLDDIYKLIGELEAEQKITVSLLIICGDFQALRNPADFEGLAVPHKYRHMGTFYRYYSQQTTAPLPTIFIGGNHEASNYLQELPYGGWVAPGIYYLGLAGVVNFGGLRIAGMSGIFKSGDFGRGHHETLPFGERELRSIYHVRSLELFRLKLLKPENIDISLSHDWPRGIWQYGNVQQLLRFKPYFRQDIETGILGSPPAEELLYHLRPRFHFSGHMHCKFTAKVCHPKKEGDNARETSFLALNKVLPGRQFLEIVDIPSPCDDKLQEESPSLELDPEWLCILKKTSALWNYNGNFNQLPTHQETIDSFQPTEEEMLEIRDDFGGDFTVPNNFEITAPCFDESSNSGYRLAHYLNPQTSLICQMLDIENPCVEWGRRASRRGVFVVNPSKNSDGGDDKEEGAQTLLNKASNPDEIEISFEDEDAETNKPTTSVSAAGGNVENVVAGGENPDEIHVSFDSSSAEDDNSSNIPEPVTKKPKSTSDNDTEEPGA